MNTTNAQSRNDVVARYTVALHEPLIMPSVARAAWRQMLDLLRTDPDWVIAWWSTVLHVVVATLPHEDPWRSMSARSDRHTLRQGDCPDPDAAPAEDAWTREGMPFGTWGDGVDLVRNPRVSDPAADHRLAALARDLDPLEASWLAFAGHSASALHAAASALHASLHMDPDKPEVVWSSMDRVLRWATYRRRQYMVADTFVVTLMEAAGHAADGATGHGEDEIDLFGLRLAGQIEAGAHTATVAAIIGVE